MEIDYSTYGTTKNPIYRSPLEYQGLSGLNLHKLVYKISHIDPYELAPVDPNNNFKQSVITRN